MSLFPEGGVDTERGTVTSGGRGYYLMGPAVLLQQGLIQLALQQLVQGADLVGRKVVIQPAPDAALIEGTVTAMSRQDQQLAIMVDGQRFLLDQVVGVVQS